MEIPYWSEDDDQDFEDGGPFPNEETVSIHYEDEYHQPDLGFAERL